RFELSCGFRRIVRFAFCTGCQTGTSSVTDIVWRPLNRLNQQLPEGIKVYEGEAKRLPLRAWYVEVDEPDPRIRTDIVTSTDTDRRETVSSFARRLNAHVVVNGGYFRMDTDPARHVGLLLDDGRLIEPSISAVTYNSQKYPLARAALGITKDDRLDIVWTFNRGDTLLVLDEPLDNHPDSPDSVFRRSTAGSQWNVYDAVGGGPALISNGKIRITTDEEVFFGTSIPKIHPRTACGYRADGALIILVVDGRQYNSRGVNLQELAAIMQNLGCVEALNLDGGGSSTLVVAGHLVNQPAGNSVEREVMSALAVFSK
ncbi:MAG: phosphodiester glycosidase family protein, partial [Candidatus Marinimicrobia bacterium]|nr:phosphodiester glycosidase family protein [Candidatus Neomarinimicrobiota bacterium]